MERIAAFQQSQVGTNIAGRFDELVATRPRLMLVAALGLVKSMRLDRLAKTLCMPASELSPHISELAGAQYVQIRGDAKDSLRQRISLSDAGFSAYTAHVQALRTAA